jgi:hypothetical protein
VQQRLRLNCCHGKNITAVGGVGLALAIGFSVDVCYKETYAEEGFLSDKDKKT